MTAHPTVSVIVAAFNAEATIRQCLESMLKQDFRDFELIVVDDHSSDRTALICAQYAAADSRVRCFNNIGGKGAASARNVGLDNARGTYLLFVDADDWMRVSALNTLIESAHRTQADLAISAHVQYRGESAQHLNDYGRKGETVYEGQGLFDCILEYLDRPYKNVMLVHCWGKLFKREIVERHGIRFEASLTQLEDLNFVFSYLSHIKTMVFMPIGLYFHRIDNSACSMSAQTGMESRAPEKYGLAFQSLDKCLNALRPGNAVLVQKLVGATCASFMILTILRLCRAFTRKPSLLVYRRIGSIVSAALFQDNLRRLAPRHDEAVLLYLACRTRIVPLVCMAGVLRILYLKYRSRLSLILSGGGARHVEVKPVSKYSTITGN